MMSTTASRKSDKRKARPNPRRCFRTKSVGGRCYTCTEPIEDVAHVALTGKAVYCGSCCPECSAAERIASA